MLLITFSLNWYVYWHWHEIDIYNNTRLNPRAFSDDKISQVFPINCKIKCWKFKGLWMTLKKFGRKRTSFSSRQSEISRIWKMSSKRSKMHVLAWLKASREQKKEEEKNCLWIERWRFFQALRFISISAKLTSYG